MSTKCLDSSFNLRKCRNIKDRFYLFVCMGRGRRVFVKNQKPRFKFSLIHKNRNNLDSINNVI